MRKKERSTCLAELPRANICGWLSRGCASRSSCETLLCVLVGSQVSLGFIEGRSVQSILKLCEAYSNIQFCKHQVFLRPVTRTPNKAAGFGRGIRVNSQGR